MTDDIRQLEYNSKWVDFGLLTAEKFREQFLEFKSGKDSNKEHFRYRTFTDFLNANKTLTDATIHNIFELIRLDIDRVMALTMGLDILKRKTLTQSQFDFVSTLLLETFGQDAKKYIDRETIWRSKRN